MAGASIQVTLNDKTITAALGRLQAMAHDTTPLMRAIGVGLVENTRRRFEQAVDPDGFAWKPLLPAYAAVKTGPGILREAGMRGGLMGSLTFDADARSVIVGTNKIYGAVHQFGAIIRAKNKRSLVFRFGCGALIFRQSVTIPARPYLGFSHADEDTVQDVADGYFLRALGG